MKLRSKILFGYGVAVVLMSLVIIWAVANLFALGRASNAILFENYRSILAADNMLAALERQDSALLLVLTGDEATGRAQYTDNDAGFLTWFARAQDNITLPGEGDLISAIEADYRHFRPMMAGLSEARTHNEGSRYYHETAFPLFAKIRSHCESLRALNEAAMYQVSAQANRISQYATWSTIIFAAAIMGTVLALSLMFSARVTRPLQALMQASRRIAAGEYAVEVPKLSSDELGQLAGEFNRMARQLAQFHELNIGQIIAGKQKNESILAGIEDGLIVFDGDLRVTDINSAARRILGAGADECRGMGCSALFPGQELCDQIRGVALTSGADAPHEEGRFITLPGPGGLRHYSIGLTAIRDTGGELTGIVLLLRDVTRLKEVERLKSEFVMAASHELRTPLTGMTMSIELLREHTWERLEERDRELLQAAHEEVQRLKALVSDLLDLSKIEAGKIELEYEPLNVGLLFDRVAGIFHGQLQAKSVDFSAVTPPDLPLIRADANKVVWILSNLVSNALRYVPEGGHIRLSGQKAGGQVHISVADDGPGIPSEYQSRIFQRFVQVEGRETGGTGLGLAICKEIVRAHGGAIWVESTPGSGSTFTFTLPAMEGE